MVYNHFLSWILEVEVSYWRSQLGSLRTFCWAVAFCNAGCVDRSIKDVREIAFRRWFYRSATTPLYRCIPATCEEHWATAKIPNRKMRTIKLTNSRRLLVQKMQKMEMPSPLANSCAKFLCRIFGGKRGAPKPRAATHLFALYVP